MPLLALTGWLLAVASLFSWSAAFGAEFGVTYAVIVFACLVWALVFASRDATAAGQRAPARVLQPLARPVPARVLGQSAKFLLSVPAAGVLALLLSVAVVLYMPLTLLTKIALAILLYPLFWAALSAWICAQQHLAKPAVIMTGLLLFSSLVLFV